MRQLCQQRGAAFAADIHQEAMLAVQQFGQRQVETGLRTRSGMHRDAETRAARLAAVHRDDERAVAPRLVVRIDMRTAEEHVVLDGDRMQFAGPHGEEGKALLRRRIDRDAHAAVVAFGAEQREQRRVQEALPGMRADGIAEQRGVIAPAQAIMAAVLLVGPARRQVVEQLDVVIDDRLVAPGGAEQAKALRAQGGDQRGKAVQADHRGCSVVGTAPGCTAGGAKACHIFIHIARLPLLPCLGLDLSQCARLRGMRASAGYPARSR